MPLSFAPPLRPQHFDLLAQPLEFRVDGPRPCHDYNVPAAVGPRNQGPNQFPQAPLDAIPNDGVTQLAAHGEADPRPAKSIIAYEQGQVLGRHTTTRSQGPVEIRRPQEPGAPIHRRAAEGLASAAACGRGKLAASLAATGLDHLDAAGRRHTRAKAVDLHALTLLGLMGPLDVRSLLCAEHGTAGPLRRVAGRGARSVRKFVLHG